LSQIVNRPGYIFRSANFSTVASFFRVSPLKDEKNHVSFHTGGSHSSTALNNVSLRGYPHQPASRHAFF
jgi:hypothetical protein